MTALNLSFLPMGIVFQTKSKSKNIRVTERLLFIQLKMFAL